MCIEHTFRMHRVHGSPGRVIIRCRPGSDALYYRSRRPARLFESLLESHKKILNPLRD